MKVTLRLILMLALAFLAMTSCATNEEGPRPAGRSGGVVESSPDDLKAAISALKGRPVVVNYWATWCDPCKKEMPRLTGASERYAGRVAFLGVNVEDDLSAARRFARRYGIPFRSYALSKADVQREQNILGLPVTQFYRADGELGFVHQGEISAQDLEDKVEELLRVGRPADKS